jgi:hypothetical protein
MRRTLATVAGIVLTACVVDQSYSPGDDPLLRKFFEQLLSQDRISYKIDEKGRYRVSSGDWDVMIRRGEEAIAKIGRTVELYGKGSCPDGKLRAYLRGTSITFVELNDGGITRFRARAEDSESVKMLEHLAEFEFDCDREREAKKPHA